jgi:hypothetical protein
MPKKPPTTKNTPPTKKQKKSSSNEDDVVLLSKGRQYTRQELADMDEKEFLGLSTRQDNCRFYVPQNLKEHEYGENSVTVC